MGSVVRGISKSDFLRQFQEDADFARAWATRLAREVQPTRLRSEIPALRTVAERLEAWLTWHGLLPAKGELKQVALQIGVSPEALYRKVARRNT